MSQIEKNTVSAKAQLDRRKFVTFEWNENEKIRILFVGNSITLHAAKEELGWELNCGMAASKKENDYVHIVMEYVKRKYGAASFCICQVAEWERQYTNGSAVLELYEKGREFNADVIVMRLAENCPQTDFDSKIFIEEYQTLLHYLNPQNTKKIIITSSFWKHIADSSIQFIAQKLNLPFVYLGDLGEIDEMKAIGRFEHSGVAAHPGDKGMREIAKRIIAKDVF